MKSLLTMLISSLLMIMSLQINADNNLPFNNEGLINSINPETGAFVIGDVVYSIPPDIVINKPSGEKYTGLSLLKANMPIGFTLKGNTITEIWILDRNPIDQSVHDD